MINKILFIGGFYPSSQIEEIRVNVKKNMQVAADNYQKGLIQGLAESFKGEIEYHNFMFLPTFPFGYKKKFIRKSFFIENKSKGVNYSYINLPFLNYLSLDYQLEKMTSKLALNSTKNEVAIFYSLQPIFLKAIKKLNEYNYKGKILFIVPDLPEYMSMSKTGVIHKVLKNRHLKLMNSEIEKSDGFVILTEQMSTKLPANKPYVILEGITKPFDSQIQPSKKLLKKLNIIKEKKIILYTGNLSKKYGILELINWFTNINKSEYQLIICGDGELRDFMSTVSSKHEGVSFFGSLSIEDVRFLMMNSTLLINPRRNNEEYTKYSFPSKLIEYLASGTATVSFRLDGVPEEYYDYSIELKEDESIEYQLEKIMDFSESELNSLGESAKHFIETEKSPSNQVSKILKLLEEL